jgi:hypothetical protein
MTETLARFPSAALFVEYMPAALMEAGDSPEALLDFFRARDYRPYTFAERTRRFETVSYDTLAARGGADDYCDVLFTLDTELAG